MTDQTVVGAPRGREPQAVALDRPVEWGADAIGASKAASAGKPVRQIDALHGLRFLAAFCILFSHACSWLTNFPDNGRLAHFGDILSVYGMPLFFVLSGFVIHYNYRALFARMRLPWAVLEFLGARFARIYPLFLCFLLVGVAVDGMLQWVAHHPVNLLLALGHALTLTQTWVYIVIFGDRLVLDNGYGLSWSLSTEFFFYLFYIAAVFYLVKLDRMRNVLLAGLLVSVMAFGLMLLGAHERPLIEEFARAHMNDHFTDSWEHSVYRWFFYYSPYARVWEFIIGCLTAQLYMLVAAKPVSKPEHIWANRALTATLLVLAAGGLLYYFELPGEPLWHYFSLLKLNFGFAIPIAVVVFCVARYRTPFGNWLSAPLLVLMGEWSYSIYTVHTWTLRIFERPEHPYAIGLEIEAIFRIGIAVVLTIIVSSATYRLIEVPARRWLRQLTMKGLTRAFGAQELNVRPAGEASFRTTSTVLVLAFAVLMALVVCYQFAVVPHFTRFTR